MVVELNRNAFPTILVLIARGNTSLTFYKKFYVLRSVQLLIVSVSTITCLPSSNANQCQPYARRTLFAIKAQLLKALNGYELRKLKSAVCVSGYSVTNVRKNRNISSSARHDATSTILRRETGIRRLQQIYSLCMWRWYNE